MTGAPTDPAARPLRVMTFNIQHGAGIDRRLDLARTARVIRDAGVEVAGLQEVDRHFDRRSDFVDQAGWLGERLGMHVVFGANLDLDPFTPNQPRRQFGNALLSVHGVLDWDNTALPRSGDHEQRGLLRARVDVRGVPWQVYVTHLQHDDAAERLTQARAVTELLGTPDHPVALLIDLNATPGTPEAVVLTQRLTDAWLAAGGRGATFPNPFPYRRIDYVMRFPAGRTCAAALVTSLRARIASDHLPVVADLAA